MTSTFIDYGAAIHIDKVGSSQARINYDPYLMMTPGERIKSFVEETIFRRQDMAIISSETNYDFGLIVVNINPTLTHGIEGMLDQIIEEIKKYLLMVLKKD